jgi:iron complex outermembrane receptor protein
MYKCVFAAIGAAGLCVAASSALAQEPSAATAGGNVTADEATPLPPVVVQAPSEPIRKKAKKHPASGASGVGSSTAASGPNARMKF